MKLDWPDPVLGTIPIPIGELHNEEVEPREKVEQREPRFAHYVKNNGVTTP